MVQQVVGQEPLPAAEHMAQEILSAAAQVPQQAVGQAQHRELEVEYVLFPSFRFSFFFLRCFFFYIYKNCEQGQGRQPFICPPFYVGCCLAYIGSSIVFSGLGGFFAMGDYMLLTWVTSIRGMFY